MAAQAEMSSDVPRQFRVPSLALSKKHNLAGYFVAAGFYLPGVAPADYAVNDTVKLLVNALTSEDSHSLLPYDYYYEKFHFCRPQKMDSQAESLGSILFGDRLYSSPFELKMGLNVSCQVLCGAKIPAEDAAFINARITENYEYSWLIDGLPAAHVIDDVYAAGFRLGFVDEKTKKPYLFNHFNITIEYHRSRTSTEKSPSYRIVGVLVSPRSVAQNVPREDGCSFHGVEPLTLVETAENNVPYTYNVEWRSSSVSWGTLFAVLGFLSPSSRGALSTMILIFYMCFAGIAGYVSARIYKMLGGEAWKTNVLLTAILVPGTVYLLFILLNFFLIANQSSAAVPFGTMLAVIALWFVVSAPLCIVGSYFGFKHPAIENPVKTNQIPRQVPSQPLYLNVWVSALIGGILPFGAIFIELWVIMNSIWFHRLYYIFGFLFLVFLILLITCAEVSILLCYFHLCAEDWRWQWRAFLTSAASGGYVFFYSVIYFFRRLKVDNLPSTILYFGWSFVTSLLFSVLTGTVGYLATLVFVRKIFSNAKAYDHAVEAYLKSATANKEEGSLFIAGKQLEQAAQLLSQQLQKPQEAAKVFQEASDYFTAHGSPDRAAEMLEKAAKQLESTDITSCLNLYKDACGIYEAEDKMRSGADTFSRAIATALRANKVAEAIDFSKQLTDGFLKMQNRPSFNKQALSTIILALLQGDDVEASKRFEQYSSFGESDEGKIAFELVEAFREYDDERLNTAVKKPTVKYLEAEVVRASMRLRVPGGAGSAPRAESGSKKEEVYQFEDDNDLV
ncbi:hypothetical protein HDU96_000521 [Phlyctochytrium bullatum]|nr:hypothetical protein HDU96_000521 [Phlyctochytrium bullatum]